MKSKSDLWWAFILLPLDAAAIMFAFIAAYYFRLNVESFPISYVWPFPQYLKFALILLPFWLIIFALEGLYDIKANRRVFQEISQVLLAVSSGIFLVMAWVFLSRNLFFSRLVVIYAWALAIVFIIIERNLLIVIRRYVFQLGYDLKRVAIIGQNKTAEAIIDAIRTNRRLGFRVAGQIGIHNTKDLLANNLGQISDIRNILKNHKIDEVILAETEIPAEEINKIRLATQLNKVTLRIVPSLLNLHTTNFNTITLAGIPVFEVKETRLEGWGRIYKRVIDIIFSLIALILLLPINLIVALLVKLTSPGPVFYRNERVNHLGKFNLYKFRTMNIEFCTGGGYGGKSALQYEKELIKKQNTRKGAIYKVGNDPRLTPIGSFLRRTSLDELPQFINSLKGDISVVGPRPHQPREVARYSDWQKKLLIIKPGITGFAQISGRSDLDFIDEARLEKYYIENWSPWLDVQIIIKTVFVLLKPRRAA